MWLLWADAVRLKVLEKSHYFMFAKIEDANCVWILGMVYGDPGGYANSYIWERITYYATQHGTPLCVVGDFNAILHPGEKLGGSKKTKKKHSDFKKMVVDAGLIDLGYSGPAYTWTNYQQGSNLILERLDRALAMVDWTVSFPKSAIFHLPRINSDHNPILIRTESRPRNQRKAFKVENWWMMRHDFQEEVCAKVVLERPMNWDSALTSFRKRVHEWLKQNPHPDQRLKVLEK